MNHETQACLPPDSDCRVSLQGGHEGLHDDAGNVMATDLEFSFRTTGDEVLPRALIVPADGASGVPIGAHVVSIQMADFTSDGDVLVSVGDCAITGGIPALRNMVPLQECLDEAYLNGPSVYNPSGAVPDDEEVPLILDKVYPAHEVVKIDYYLPGCPPPADALFAALAALLTDQPVELPYGLIKYD